MLLIGQHQLLNDDTEQFQGFQSSSGSQVLYFGGVECDGGASENKESRAGWYVSSLSYRHIEVDVIDVIDALEVAVELAVPWENLYQLIQDWSSVVFWPLLFWGMK